jgi:hypothetical protein
MHKHALKLFAAAAIAALGTIASAEAAEVKYDYTLNWTVGELAGQTSTGSLSYDSSLAVANAWYTQPDILSGFSFSMRGHTFGLSDVHVGWLTFDANAQLRMLAVGTHCEPNVCYSDAGRGNTNAFFLVYDSGSSPDHFWGAAADTGYATSSGAGTFALAPVPESSTVAMMLAGIGLVGATTRKRSAAR